MKKSLFKKLTVFLLAASILTSAAAVTAFAANGPSEYKWDENNYLAYIMLYTGNREYSVFANNKTYNNAIEGAEYDRASNTLTLTNFKHSDLFLGTNMMGDDFKLKINGDCALGAIYVWGDFYGGSLDIEGTGTLTVNKNRNSVNALVLNAEGSNARLSFGKDVKVKLYAEKNAAEINYTNYSDLKTGIIFGNGKSYDFKAGKETSEENKYLNTFSVEEYPWTSASGYKVKRESDPDGLYSVMTDGETYNIFKYCYLSEYDSVITDYYTFDSPVMTKEEFENSEYSIVYENQPVPVYYTDEWVEEHQRGDFARKATKASDPGAVYGISFGWTNDPENPTDYFIRRLVWNEKLEIYEADPSFESVNLDADEFANSDYELLKEDGDYVYIRYIYDGYEFENYAIKGDLVTKASDPGAKYARTQYDDGSCRVVKLIFNEDRGYYFEGDAEELTYVEFLNSDYSVEMEVQPVSYVTKSNVEISSMALYADQNGKEYLYEEWKNQAYDFSEENSVNILGETFYIPTPNNTVDTSSLTPVTEEVEYSVYNYAIEGDFVYNFEPYDPSHGFIKGDVNCDGKVNGIDAATLSRYTSGWNGYAERILSMEAADVNGDGVVNGADSAILARYTSGWTNYAKYFEN